MYGLVADAPATLYGSDDLADGCVAKSSWMWTRRRRARRRLVGTVPVRRAHVCQGHSHPQFGQQHASGARAWPQQEQCIAGHLPSAARTHFPGSGSGQSGPGILVSMAARSARSTVIRLISVSISWSLRASSTAAGSHAH
jgi:hypothetical protein